MLFSGFKWQHSSKPCPWWCRQVRRLWRPNRVYKNGAKLSDGWGQSAGIKTPTPPLSQLCFNTTTGIFSLICYLNIAIREKTSPVGWIGQLKFTWNSFNLQIEAIRRGLLKVLSQAVLDLLTWQELERRVCGDPELSVEALKKCSEFLLPFLVLRCLVAFSFRFEPCLVFTKRYWSRSSLRAIFSLFLYSAIWGYFGEWQACQVFVESVGKFYKR